MFILYKKYNTFYCTETQTMNYIECIRSLIILICLFQVHPDFPPDTTNTLIPMTSGFLLFFITREMTTTLQQVYLRVEFRVYTGFLLLLVAVRVDIVSLYLMTATNSLYVLQGDLIILGRSLKCSD